MLLSVGAATQLPRVLTSCERRRRNAHASWQTYTRVRAGRTVDELRELLRGTQNQMGLCYLRLRRLTFVREQFFLFFLAACAKHKRLVRFRSSGLSGKTGDMEKSFLARKQCV